MKFFSLCLLLIAFASRCAASVAVTTTSVPNGIVGKSYFAVLKATGGCTRYTWKIVSGSLPAGITKKTSSNTTDLDLTGVPAAVKSYSFTVAVTGCGGSVSKKSYKVVIQAAPDHVVDLKWKASKSTGILGYNVYRGPDGVNWRKVNNGGLVAWTHYADLTAANDSTYFYAATAVNIKGEESRKTGAIKAVVP